MKIAFLTMGKDIGGAAQDIITLSQGLQKRGHAIYVISSRGVLDKILSGTGVHFIDAPLYTRNPLQLWKVSRIIRTIAKEHHLQLLNPQGMYTALCAWMATLGWTRCTFKVVTTIHMISSLSLYKYSWALNIFSKRVVTESYCERNRLTSHGVIFNKIRVIANSVDTVRFSSEHSEPVLRKEYKIDNDCVCFGIVARLSREKRHTDFVQAARIVHEKCTNTKFLIIGEGPEWSNIERAVDGSEDYIKMVGLRRDIPDVLKSINCFVLSSNIESLPLSIREAMSMGLPVITTDVGGVREAVIEGMNGFVVPSENPELLAEAMLKIASNPDLGYILGQRGRQLCISNFALEHWVNATELFFDYVIKTK
jgi:glycosyltransferase involved in cell wall biosynthesis